MSQPNMSPKSSPSPIASRASSSDASSDFLQVPRELHINADPLQPQHAQQEEGDSEFSEMASNRQTYRDILETARMKMGQCSSIPPPDIGNDEEDFVMATTPERRRLWDQAAHRCAHPSAGVVDDAFHDEEASNLRHNFLKLHRPDRLQKCILDPSNIHAVLVEQAEHLLRERYYSDSQDDVNSLYQRIDDTVGYTSSDSQKRSNAMHGRARATSPFSEVLSDFAPSAVTTNTVATQVVSNTLKQHRPRRSVPSVDKQQQDPFATPPRGGIYAINEGGAFVRSPNGSLLKQQQKNRALMEEQARRRQEEIEMKRREVVQKYMGVFTACIQPTNAAIFDSAVTGGWEQHYREAYMSVLRLQMKAQLGHYFMRRYRRLFPAAPMPKGLARATRGEVPDLISNDSDSSSSESGDNNDPIGFGAIPQSSPILLGVTGAAFMDLALTGSLGLVPRTRTSGRSQRSSNLSHHKSPDHYLVLINRRSGTPLAVCAMKASEGLPVIRIYATKQRVAKQRAAATTGQLGLNWSTNLPLYAWAEVVTESMYPSPEHFSVYMSAGSDGKFSAHPSYIANAAIEKGSPIVKIIGRTDQENRFSGCALVSMEVSDVDDEDLRFNLDIANGIDPALLVCLTGIIDEVMEKSFRIQCKQKRQQQTWEVPQFSGHSFR